jgi:hypothetical protein
LQTLIHRIAETYNPAYRRAGKSAAAGEATRSRRFQWLFTPILAPVLKNRWLLRILTAAGLVQVLLIAAGLEGWQCPLRSALGVICPGCGLTTAVVLLVKGNLRAALQIHAFAPPVLIVLIFMTITSILPSKYRLKAANRIAEVERRTGAVALVLFGMILYWFVRIFEIV